MLPALLVFAAHARPQDDPTTPPASREAAWARVRAAGYDVVLDKPDAYTGTVVHAGLKANVSVTMIAGDPAKGASDAYPYLAVFAEWSTPKEIDPDAADRWLAENRPGAKAHFEPHLGRTASVWGFVPFMNANGAAGLRAELDAFWADLAAFSARYAPKRAPAPEATPKGLRFAPSLKLKRADDVSLQRVFGSWGWHSDETANVSVGGWCFSIRVGGRLLWVHGVQEGATFSDRRFRVERLAAEGTTEPGAPLDLANVDKLGPGTYYGGVFHPREAFEGFDVTKPPTLADLRRRIEAFARKG